MSSTEHTRVSIIAALGEGRVLGKENKLLWHIPEDLKRFKELTRGHPVIMGRKTFDSIVEYLKGPLPERTNIVITTQKDWVYPGVQVAHSVKDAIALAKTLGEGEVFIAGGEKVYAQALPLVDRLYLTLIDDTKEGDVYFPRYEQLFTTETSHTTGEHNGIRYHWVDLER